MGDDVAGRADRALTTAIDGLFDVDPEFVSDAELAEAMLGVAPPAGPGSSAVVAEHRRPVRGPAGYAEDGSQSATDWIAVHGRLPRPAGGRRGP